jgi:hypothetical protein
VTVHDLNRAGISKVFSQRLVLRMQAMLRKMEHGGLPGVAEPGIIKTTGTVEWVDTGVISRLFDTATADDYYRIGLQAVDTLMEGTVRRSEVRSGQELAALSTLCRYGPPLSASHVQNRQDDNTRVTIEVRKELRVRGRPGRRPVPVVEEEAVEEGLDEEQGVDLVAEEEPVVGQQEAVSSVVVLAVERSGSRASMGSSRSSRGEWDSDESVSTEDSRDSCSGGSEEDTEAATTVEFGFSVQSAVDPDEFRQLCKDRSPSPACTSGSE